MRIKTYLKEILERLWLIMKTLEEIQKKLSMKK